MSDDPNDQPTSGGADRATLEQYMALADAANDARRASAWLGKLISDLPGQSVDWRPPINFVDLAPKAALLIHELTLFEIWVNKVKPRQ